MKRKGLSLAEVLVALGLLALVVTGSMVYLQSNLMYYRRQISATRLSLLCQDWLRGYQIERGAAQGTLEGLTYALDVDATTRPQGAWLHLSLKQGPHLLMKQSLWRASTQDAVVYQSYEDQVWKRIEVDGPALVDGVAVDPPVSPDAREILWKGRTLVRHDNGVVLHPRANPEGTLMAYLVQKSEETELWVHTLAGSKRGQCWLRGSFIDPPSWLPGGKVILCRGGEELIEVSRTESRTLYRGEGLSAPDVSSDGNSIAFIAQDPKHKNNDVYVFDFPSKQVKNITQSPEGEIRPLWSSRSNKLLFALALQSGGYPLYCINADGTGRQDLNVVASGIHWNWKR